MKENGGGGWRRVKIEVKHHKEWSIMKGGV